MWIHYHFTDTRNRLQWRYNQTSKERYMDSGNWNTEGERHYTAEALQDTVRNINRVLKNWKHQYEQGLRKSFTTATPHKDDLKSMCLGYLAKYLRVQRGWQQVRRIIHGGDPIFQFDMKRCCVINLRFNTEYPSLNAIAAGLEYDVLNAQAEAEVIEKATEVSEISFASIEAIKF